MYCEVFVKHRAIITEAGLQAALQGRLGADIDLNAAYGMSQIYRDDPPAHSLYSFETVRSCFVIVRRVNSRFSTYHVEGNTSSVPVQTLQAAVQDFAGLLLPLLRTVAGAPAYEATSVTVELFEDNGRETGVKGRLTTVSSILRERFAWTSLRASVIAFLTGLLLIWQGLKKEPLRAGIYSLAFVLIFTLLESAVGYLFERGKIKW